MVQRVLSADKTAVLRIRFPVDGMMIGGVTPVAAEGGGGLTIRLRKDTVGSTPTRPTKAPRGFLS